MSAWNALVSTLNVVVWCYATNKFLDARRERKGWHWYETGAGKVHARLVTTRDGKTYEGPLPEGWTRLPDSPRRWGWPS